MVNQSLEGAATLAQAGTDRLFIPGLTNLALIAKICQNTILPVNVLMRGNLETIAQVADLGVARASYGPAPYFAAMQDITARFNSLSSERLRENREVSFDHRALVVWPKRYCWPSLWTASF